MVTGGTGFIGSHVAEALIKKGATVVIPYRSINPRSYFAVERLDRHCHMVCLDLVDHTRVYDCMVKYSVSYVYHFAAQSNVPQAYENPLESFSSNIMGTAAILDACRRHPNVKGIIISSSDKAYGKQEKTITENTPFHVDHPYELSKSVTDQLAYVYAKTYNLPILISRAANIYGPGDFNATRIIPSIMRTLITKEPLTLRSTGTMVRDYLYIEDAVKAFLFLLSFVDSQKGEAFNISSDEAHSTKDIIAIAVKTLKTPLPFTVADQAKNEIPAQRLDATKMKSLGWKPTWTIETGLKATYYWYKRNKKLLFL